MPRSSPRKGHKGHKETRGKHLIQNVNVSCVSCVSSRTAGPMARDRRVRPQGDVDRRHHRPLRRRQADRGLGRAGPARPLPAAQMHSHRVVDGARAAFPASNRRPSGKPP